MPIKCSFRTYKEAGGTDAIKAYYEKQSGQWKAKFWGKLVNLAQLEIKDWPSALYKDLRRDCTGIGEIRFEANGVMQRPLGFRSGPREFTLVFCATEKSNRFVPANACEIALRRKQEIREGKRETNALWLALE